MQTAILKIEGMTCNHCKATVTEALEGVDGVASVTVDLAKGEARVTYDPAKGSVAELERAVEEAGYRARLA